jgi:transcriptional regulator with XRE-family HTH domain
MPNDRTKIATRLKEARDYLGLAQQEVATALGVPRSAISMMESGQRGVDTVELKALARLYQRPVGYLTGEEEPKFSSDVEMLAKQVAQLSEEDRNELMRFSEFLMQRSQTRSRDDNKT